MVIVHHPESGGGSSSVVKKSPDLVGRVSGTPVISSDGNYVYVTHNVDNNNNNKNGGGYFSVLDSVDANIIFQQSCQIKWNSDQKYGPIGIAHNPQQGFYNGGENNNNDMLVWGPYPDNDYTYNLIDGGNIYGFQIPQDYKKGRDKNSYGEPE